MPNDNADDTGFFNTIINIISNIFSAIGNIANVLNPFSEDFFVYKLIELLGDLLKWLFIPSDDYFENIKNDLLDDLKSKLPYNDYINMFSSILDVGSDGEMSDIELNNYKVGDTIINVPNFIDFSFITKYKDTWYTFVRGFVFIFLIIFHVNQLNKFLRGFPITDGAIRHAEKSSKGGKNK